jgi:polysaccharide deacetylase family protein (PEP-CTERM system associated)
MQQFQNIFTIDLEEWFVVEILSERYERDEWTKLPSRVEATSLKLLQLLNRHQVKATWFVLGWCADRFPDLIQEIFRSGHEIACHSYFHRRVDQLTPDEFRRDTEQAINSVVKTIGNAPFGYRAPSWSISADNPWAFEVLSDLGFLYDSSVFPIKHDIYGWPGGPRLAFKMRCKNGKILHELPATTFRMLGKNIPLGGGGYFRHSPYWYSKNLIKKLNAQNQPAVFYVHPWEIESDLPHLEGLSFVQKFRTYSSTTILRHKIERLLEDFSFTSAADYLQLFKKNRIGF